MRLRTFPHALLLVVMPCLGIVSSPSLSHAQPAAAAPSPDQVKEAQSHFKKGSDLFAAKKADQALEEFRKSYNAVQSPNSHLYIARCFVALGQYKDAYNEFDLVIAEAEARSKDEPKYAPTRDTAQLERDEIANKVGLITVEVTGAPPEAKLTVAGVAVPRERWGKPTPISPGGAEVILEVPGKPPMSRLLTLIAGAKETVQFDVLAAPAGGGAGTGDTSGGNVGGDTGGGADTGGDKKSSPLRPAAFAAAGLGVAGFAMFGVLGSMSNSTYNDLKTLCGGEQTCPTDKLSQASDLVSKGNTQKTLANVGLIVGAVGIAAAVPLFVLSLKKPKSAPSTALIITPTSTTLAGTF